jgi:hypothetical protein
MMNDRAAAAEKLKKLLIESSPMIEEYTREVCPACMDVCCRQKHGVYQKRDILYLKALGVDAPLRSDARPLDGPCESMGPLGCIQPRWMRPFKCTWYFCDPLIKTLNERPQRKARRLSAIMQEMIRLFDSLC